MPKQTNSSNPPQPTHSHEWPLRSKEFWDRVTDPHPSIKESERRRARILSGMLLSVILIGALAIPVSLVTDTSYSYFAVLALGLMGIGLAYWLSRSPYFFWASLTTITMIYVSVLSSANISGRTSSLEFLALGIIIGSLIFSTRQMLILSFITFGLMLTPFFFVTTFPSEDLITETFFLAGISILATVGTSISRRDLAQIEAKDRQLNEAQRVAHIGNWEWDIPTDQVTWSDELFRLYGLPPREVEVSYETFLERVHPEDREFVGQIIQQALRDHQPFDFEDRIIWPDGTMRWQHALGEVIVNETGQPKRMRGTGQDITERKQAEEILRRRLTELTTIHRVAQRLSDVHTPETLAQEIIHILEGILSYEYSAILLIAGDSDRLIPFALSDQGKGVEFQGQDKDHINNLGIVLGKGITGWVAQNGQTIRLGDVHQDARYIAAREGIRSELCVPLLVSEQIIGVVNIETTRSDAYSESDQHVLETIAAQMAIAIQNARLFEETSQRLQRLTALRIIDSAISGNLDLKIVLNIVLKQATQHLGMDAASVLLVNSDEDQILTYAAATGYRTRAIEHTRLQLDKGLLGLSIREGQVVHIHDPFHSPDFVRAALLAGEDFVESYQAPMTIKDRVVGVLEVFHRAPHQADKDWLTFLETLAKDAAIAVNNAQLFQDLQRSNTNLSLAYDATIEGWSRAMDLRDKETEGHTQRVTELTIQLARAVGIDEADLVHIRRGGLLHDMGKLGVPDNVLLKSGKLTEEEWALMKQHPQFAYDMLSAIEYLLPALDIPYCHHEKWDGTGYPRGLQGEQIPLAARLFSIVDVYDALASDRPYRPAWTEEKTIAYIREQSGTHFDAKLVEVFLKVMNKGTKSAG